MCQYLLSSNHTWVCEENLSDLNSTTIDTYLTLKLKEKQEVIKIEEYSSNSEDEYTHNINVKNVTNVSSDFII